MLLCFVYYLAVTVLCNAIAGIRSLNEGALFAIITIIIIIITFIILSAKQASA